MHVRLETASMVLSIGYCTARHSRQGLQRLQVFIDGLMHAIPIAR